MDSRSLNNLNTLHPKFRPVAIAAWTEAQAAMPANVQIIVIQGLRSMADSNALYAQGRTLPGQIVTNAPGGSSYHNYGLAFDFAMVTYGKDDNVVGPNWMKVVSIMESHGMTWGGTFPTIIDDPHFENRFSLNWRQLLEKWNNNDTFTDTNGIKYVNI